MLKPPYSITSLILEQTASIFEKLGEIKSANLQKAPTELRKKNRIKTIQSSLEIEGNTLSTAQITALLEGKRILAPEKDILEVKNAIKAYELLNEYEPYKLASLCKAHKILMTELVKNPGKLRTQQVGIAHGESIKHIAPPHSMVESLLNNLLAYLKNDSDLLLIKSCVFHYEFEFIHPFMDGNGRMGQLWQPVILKDKYPVFEFLPIETLIKKEQKSYYKALALSDSLGHSTPFIEFMLNIIKQALEELLQSQNISLTGKDRIQLYKNDIGLNNFSRQEYMRYFKTISSATASRDLKDAVAEKIIEKTGDKRLTIYKYFPD
ncbi:Fic family protein [Solitalea canadensis]|uniref:Fido domain-containing protein n=1 Tax=Solitalea canadensis (strain ATCC 29591 / DSM 3403 / JCM 21819 / LMG 8368 / NBRC 15130 / NCIMB 12057 / USAM 9D) TaxID=929556 RepID=H8KVX2_SOLCM|nr:Fic family protein [Solitalea canadensis]AFD06875.1 hypothetical protein Solca_1813 [Solitalea canadensis DSM 3403]